MLKLDPQQLVEVRKAGEKPVLITDPDTHDEYVVVKATIFERMKRFTEEVDFSLYEFEEVPAAR